MERGYIKLWRAICDSELYFSEKFTKSQAWIDLLLLANHKQNTLFVRGIVVKLEPGEVLAGEEYLAKRWKWSREKVRNYLSLLSSETRQQIIWKKSNVCSVVVIAKWHLYQQDRTANRTTEKHQTEQQKNIPKNEKNDKKSICPEPKSVSSPAEEKKFLTFSCTGESKEFHLLKPKVEEYRKTYDTLDVEQELKKARQWLSDNPGRRKTARGMTRFLGNWLSRAADRGSFMQQSDRKPRQRPLDCNGNPIQEVISS